MDQHKDILIKRCFEKTNEALALAREAINRDYLNGAQNRIYYAIFYSVLALGYLEGFVTGKHKELQGWFNYKFIYENKVFDENIYQIYKTIYDDRIKYDYDVKLTPNKITLCKQIEDAEFFVKTVSEYINSRMEGK